MLGLELSVLGDDGCSGSCNGQSHLGLGECRSKTGGSPWCFVNQDSSCSDVEAFKPFFTSYKACAGMSILNWKT